MARERSLTFILSCWFMCAVCFGLGVATVAGLAYGYNYAMAEFLTLKRTDVKVFSSRGQFVPKPDLPQRRTENTKGYNYQDMIFDDQNYQQQMYSASKSTNMETTSRSARKQSTQQPVEQYNYTTNILRNTSSFSHETRTTVVQERESSEINMRNLIPMSEIYDILKENNDKTENNLSEQEPISDESHDAETALNIENISERNLIQMSYWRKRLTTSSPENESESDNTYIIQQFT